MGRRSLGSAALLLAVLWGGQAVAADDVLMARGHEPSWRLKLSKRSVTFEAPGQGITFTAASPSRKMVSGKPRFIARDGKHRLLVAVDQSLCADKATGMAFPAGVSVTFEGRVFEGCGGETLTALAGGWRVVKLAGDVPRGVTMTIDFGRDGRVAGRSGCNRYAGPFTLSAEALQIGPVVGTRMACPPEQMAAETKFLDLLSKVTRVTPAGQDRLSLMAGDSAAMVIDRAD